LILALRTPGAAVSLDPDLPLRGGAAALHPADRDADAVLARGVWTLVRAGMFERALEHCRQCGQPWRAAVLAGSRLFHDPMAAGEDGCVGGLIFFFFFFF
jgi:hypothetical protein